MSQKASTTNLRQRVILFRHLEYQMNAVIQLQPAPGLSRKE
jgi:hypothetical protein